MAKVITLLFVGWVAGIVTAYVIGEIFDTQQKRWRR